MNSLLALSNAMQVDRFEIFDVCSCWRWK